MNRMQNSSEYRIAIDKLTMFHPEEVNTRRMMEESAELIQAVNKMQRFVNNEECGDINKDTVRNNLIGEMADVLICIDIMRSTYTITDKEIDKALLEKMERNLHRLNISKANGKAQAMKVFAAAHECCGRCVD